MAFCRSTHSIIEDFCNLIAELNHYPNKDDVIAKDSLSVADWESFYEYTENVNPHVSLRSEYVPMADSKQLVVSEVSLY